jgi:enterobacterial common antigen flippase
LLGSGFATSIVTARALGPIGRGDYFFVITLCGTLVQVSNLGLHASNTYLVARDPALARALTVNSGWVALSVGTIVGAIAVAVAAAFHLFGIPIGLLWYGGALVPASLFFLLGTNLLVGMNRIAAFNVVESVSRVVVIGLLLLAAALAFGARGFLAMSLIGWYAVAILLGVLLHRAGGTGVRFRPDVFRQGLRYAGKTYLVALLGYFVLRGNVFLLQHYQGSANVGFFSIAAQTADVIAILPTSVALVLFPQLVRDEVMRWEVAWRHCRRIGVALVVACAAIAALAGPFVRIAYGAGYGPSVTMLRLLLPGVVAIGMTTVLSQYLGAIGLPRALVAVWAIAFAALILLGLWLVPRYAANGAAALLSAVYCGVFVLVLWLAHRHRNDAR